MNSQNDYFNSAMVYNPFSAIIGALILAWFLSLFGVDQLFVRAVNENSTKQITTASYYMFFFIVAVIFGTTMWIYGLSKAKSLND